MSTLSLILASCVFAVLGFVSLKIMADHARTLRMRKVPIKIDKHRA